MGPHVELAVGQTKVNQWQPAETNQIRVVPDLSHVFVLTHYHQQLSDFAVTLTFLLLSPLKSPDLN